MRPIVTFLTLGIGLAPLLGSAALASQSASRPALVRTQQRPEAPSRIAPTAMLPRIAKMFRLAQQPAPQSRPDRAGSYIYTCEYYSSDCRVFTPKYKLLSVLTQNISEPQGTVADPSGHWYIANTGYSNVPVYTAGGGSLYETYDDTGYYPGDVALDSAVVAVSNIAGVSGGPGNMNTYCCGSLTPTGNYTVADAGQGISARFDSHGNCYWAYNDEVVGGGDIEEWVGCTGFGKLVVSGLGFAGGMAFDKKDNLYYTDQSSETIYKCAGLTNCRPLSTAFGDPLQLNFDKNFKHLWVDDPADYLAGELDPKTGTVLSVISVGGPSNSPPLGVALGPGAPY
jgi:hypothetical protein